jgi:hypothetical protein
MPTAIARNLPFGAGAGWLGIAFLSSQAGASPPTTEFVTATAISPPGLYCPKVLEATGATIGSITIKSGDVFDLNDPREDGAFYRFMNSLHIETRDDVIRNELLFRPGDAYRTQLVEETERLLRTNEFLAEASIEAAHCADGTVDLVVDTTDTWSLTPSVSFSRKGGKNFGGVKIEESNLFGTGSELQFGYKADIERDELYADYRDSQLGSSRLSLRAGISNNSDGRAYIADIQQPFYALDARRAFGIFVAGFDQHDPLYRLGEIQSYVRQQGSQEQLFLGWSRGLRNGWARRWRSGIGNDAHEFEAVPGFADPAYLPHDRKDVYLFVGIELLQDRFESTRNTDNLGRVEDRHFGGSYEIQLGYASEALGSSDEAFLLRIRAAHGFHPTANQTLLLESYFDGRYSGIVSDKFRAGFGARFYRRQSEKRLFVAELLALTGRQYDTDQIPTLGGETGLRGFPIGFQTGDKKVQFSLEQRVFTDWYPFRIFRVGGAAFLDVGRVWGGDASANLGTLSDVGIGLRIGSPRSSTGKLLHIDLAWPLDGPKEIRGAHFVVEAHKSF